MEAVKALAEGIGADAVAFKTAQIYDYKNGSPLIPENETFSRYRRRADGTYAIKNKLLNHCWKLWHSCVITWDGTVVPCCFDKDAWHRMGDLRQHRFATIWKNGEYRDFRAKVLKARSNIDMCSNCSEGGKVWAGA
jgi:radical SAM protein with 4Fe4S-binding SPASM domain